MTQEQVPEQNQKTDVVTQVQNEMDAEQGSPETAQPLTQEQVKGMLEEQARGYERQIAGLTSKVDRGLNTMRSIAEGAQQATGVLRSDVSFEQLLTTMDEDQRAAALAWRDADRKANAPVQPVDQEPAQNDNWERVYQMAENMGLDRNDPNIRYTVLSDMTLTEVQREQQFMASLSTAVQQKGQAAAPAPAGTAPATEEITNPPVDRGAAGTGSPMNTQDQIMDAFIEGKLNSTQYRERMAAIGIAV